MIDIGGRNQVVLVDSDGNAMGVADKLDAHQAPGQLHLAFSVFLFDQSGRLLIQRRAATKYHFPRVWANSCCSHPQPGEDLVAAAESRVAEELGLKIPLTRVGSFSYKAACPTSGLVENEFDWVLVGKLNDVPRPDSDEVEAIRMLAPEEFHAASLDATFAPWFASALAIAISTRG